MTESIFEIGQRGERTAWKILQDLGFEQASHPAVDFSSASDLDVKRMGQKFAINVKYSKNGTNFIITYNNLRRLIRFRELGFKPAFMFLSSGNYYLFTLEDNFPQNARNRQKPVMELFADPPTSISTVSDGES